MKKSILSILLCFSIILALFAFRKSEVTVIATGKVFDQTQPLQSVEVVVGDHNMYYESTLSSGSYRLQFNTKEGKPTYLLYKKPGYTTFRQPLLPVGEDLDNLILPDVHLLKLSSKNNRSFVKEVTVPIFKNMGSDQFEEVPLSSIAYFEWIQPESSLDKNSTGTWYRVNFTLVDSDLKNEGWLFQ